MKKIAILGDDAEAFTLAKRLQEEVMRRGKNREIRFSTIGKPTPLLNSIGKGISSNSFDQVQLHGSFGQDRGEKLTFPNELS